MLLGRVAVTTMALGLLLAGCGDDSTAQDAATQPDTGGSVDGSASASPSQDGGSGPRTSSCQGMPGDGQGAELTTVELKELGDNLQITYRTDAPVESRDVVLYVVDAWNPDGDVGYQLGLEIDRRGEASEYLLSYPDEVRSDVDAEAEVGGTTVIATYPMDSLGNVGQPFKWSATLKIGADPADHCPAWGDGSLPERVTFP